MKRLASILFFVVFLFMFTTNVYASNEIMLEVDKNKIDLGGEITISIDLKMESKETSLYAYTAKLSYDKDVFDVIKTENFQEKENWSDIVYNKSNNKFALINKKGITGEKLLEIKLKVKNNATPGKTTITVNSVKASDGKKEISLKSDSIEVMILKDGLAEGESIPVNKENNSTEEDIAVNIGGDFRWISYICIAIMLAIIIFLIYYNIKNKDNEELDDKRITITIILIVILILMLIPTVMFLFTKSADVNKDGQVDYSDVKNIIEYLLEIKNPEENKNINDKDLNNDGNISIGDVGSSTEQAGNQNHNVNINGSDNNSNNSNNNNNNNNNGNDNNQNQPSNPTNPNEPDNPDEPSNPTQPDNPQNPNEPSKPDNPNEPSEPDNPDESGAVINNKVISTLTPKKGEEITLDLYIDVTPYTEVEEVEIGEKFYKVEKVNNSAIRLASILPVRIKSTAINKIAQKNNHYIVKLPAPNVAKIYELTITKIKLDNNKEIETNYSIMIDVLKDKPKVEGLKIDSEKEKPEISFNVEDPDGAFKNGTFIIKDEEGNEVYRSKPGEIHVGENKFAVELEDGKIYNYEFNIDYDLDHNYFSENLADNFEKEEDFIGESFGDGNGNLEFSRDYGFINKNMEITKKVSTQDDLILSFENDYDSYYDVRGIKIGDVEYPVQKDANRKYTVILPKGEKGNNSILIKSAVLENGVSYEINKEMEYIYLKDKPNIDKVYLQSNDGKMHIDIEIIDADDTIKNVMVRIEDESGEVLEEKMLEDMHSGDLEISTLGKYIVKVEAIYDLGDEILEKLIGTYEIEVKEEIKQPIEAKIITSRITNYYVSKGGNIEITYTIEDNTDEDVKQIRINGVALAATKVEDGIYNVSMKAPIENIPQNRKIDLEATEIIYENDSIDVVYSTEIEILKTMPSITEMVIDDSEVSKQGKPKLNFVLNDEDDAILDGNIIIKKLDTNEEETIELQKDLEQQSYILENIEEFAQYRVEIKINYDLDTDCENEKNEGSITESHDFMVQENYYLLIEEFMIKEITDGKVILQFESTNKSVNVVERVLIGFNGENKQYEVTKGEDNLYTLEIPLSEFNEERTDLTLEAVTLSNLKQFNRETYTDVFEGIDSLLIFKTKPTAVIGNVILDEAKNLITVNNIEFTDNDNTLLNKYAVLKLNGEVIQEILINEQTGVMFKAEDVMFEAGNYEIEILADYNINDGKEHVKELISDKSTIKVDIVAEVSKVSEKLYAKKGSVAIIEFNIKSNTKESIESVEINNEAPALFEKAENGNYKVTVNLPSETGLKEYAITKVRYASAEVSIENSPKVEVYILKDKPTITDEAFDDISDKTTYKFNFNDTEDTLISGNISVKDSEGHIEIEAQSLQKNENIIDLSNLTRGKTYTLTISATYDLDDDKEDSINTETLNKEVEFNIIDYRVSINIENVESVNKQDKEVSFTFKVTNNTEFDVSYIKLVDKFYKVDKDNDVCKVTIPYEQEIDEKLTITISEVKMSNEKVIRLENNATFDIFKKAPEATKPQITFEDEKIKASFTIKDEDNTIKELHAELKDIFGSSIGSTQIEDISAGDKQIEFDNSLAGTYKVEIVASYDRVDGEEYNDIVLSEAEDTREIIASISKAEILNKYPEKGATITIKYTVKDNTYEKVTAIEINGERNETVEEESNDIYTVSYKVPSESGEDTISVSKLYYGKDEVTVEKQDTIEVLKSALYVDAVNIDDSKVLTKEGNPVLNFHIHDEDKTFISGSVSIKDDTTEEIQNITIEKDETGNKERSYELKNIEEFKTYKVEITVNYDLDTDNGNGLNNSTVTETGEFIIEHNYELKITELHFEEGETGKVILQFKSTNKSSHIINKVLIGLNGEETKQYDATKGEDNLYTVEILLSELPSEKTTLTLAGVILDNLKEFKKETDNELFASLASFVVFKNKPKAEVGEVIVSEDKKSIIVNNINFTDEDTTITNKYIVLKLGEEEIIKAQIQENTKITINVEGDKPFKAGTYSIGILASYNIIDGNIHEEELISEEKEVEVGIVANVIETSSMVFAHKGANAVITFTIESNTDQGIESMLVNGEVPVSFTKGEEGRYEVTVTAPQEREEKEYQITQLTYNGKEIALEDSLKAKVYVLKDVPVILNSEFDDISDVPTYKFTFSDPDNTLISGNIIVKDEEGSPVIEPQALNKNEENTVILSQLTRGKAYTLSLEGTYDLDDLADEQSNIHNLEEILKDVKLNIIDYEIYLDFNKVESIDKAQKNVTVSFKVRNNTEFEVAYVKLNGEHAMHKEGELYKVEIPYEQVNDEKVEITISEVKMSNGKKVQLKVPTVFEILKKTPSATKPTLEKTEDDIITASFNVTDTDNTITSMHAELRKGEVTVESKPIQKQDTNVTFDCNRAGTYNVVIVASYDRADAEEHINQAISEKSEDIKIDIKASILSSILSTKYPNKNEEMKITYTITDNADEEITAIDMSAEGITSKYEDAKLIKESDDVYTIVYKTPSTPGIVSLKATKLYYGNVEIEVEQPDTIDVLKRRPYVKYSDETFEIFYDYKAGTVSVLFTTVDPDEAVLKDKDGQPQKGIVSFAGFVDEHDNPKPTFTMGETTLITFKDVPQNKVYMIHIYSAPYDLDSNPEDNENHYDKHYDSSLLLIRCGAFVGLPSNLNVENLKIKTDNEEDAKQLKLNEEFKISFTAEVIPIDSKYAKEYHAEYIRIKGTGTEHERTYRLDKNEKTYTTRDYIKGFDTPGPRNIEIESIILSNGEIIPMENKIIQVQVQEE